jgi:LAS superfamily LD-carboxypeptidase LdcB
MSPTAVPVTSKDTATPTATPTAVPVTSKDTATPVTRSMSPTAVPVKSKDTATPVTRSMSPTAVPVKSKDTATTVTRNMSPSTVPATAPITQQKQMGESSELSKVEKELNRFTKSNNMQHQSNKDYVANLESKRKQLLAVGGNVPEPTLPQDSTKTATATATATVTKPDDVMRLIKFQGDALGDKTHFEALDPAVKDSFINMIAEYGKPVQINAAMRDVEEQQQMWDDAKPDPNNPNKRRNSQGNPVAPPGRSRHNYGRALDLNRNQVSDLASTGLLTKYGFNTIPNDPPHIEMAKMGGVFDGPESGYPVMLHGKEAVVPENQLKAVKTLLENVTKENLSSELPTITATPTTTTASDSDSRLLVDLYNIMDDKFSTMISILTSSNDVQAELLKHSRV